MPSPDPGESINGLNGVAAITTSEAWVVGAVGFDPLSPTAVLIERWDGVAWTVVDAPSPGTERNELLAVDASEPNDVWAVGRTASGSGDRPLVLRFDGSAWSELALPEDVSGVLTSVAAISPGDVWVAGYSGEPAASLERALLLHWDGELWAIVDPGRAVGGGRSLLRDIDALSATEVWATGYRRNRPLMVRFDGQAWSRFETEERGTANAIEAITPTEAWVVGSPILRFDGEIWGHAAEVPVGGELRGVAAVSPEDVWAVGLRPRPNQDSTRSLVLRWDGGRWRIVEAMGIPGSDALTSVDALPDGTVFAAGYRDVASGRRTLIVRGSSCPSGV